MTWQLTLMALFRAILLPRFAPVGEVADAPAW